MDVEKKRVMLKWWDEKRIYLEQSNEDFAEMAASVGMDGLFNVSAVASTVGLFDRVYFRVGAASEDLFGIRVKEGFA